MRNGWLVGVLAIALAISGALVLIHPPASANTVPTTAGTALIPRTVERVTDIVPSSDLLTLQDLTIFDLRSWTPPAPDASGLMGHPAGMINVLRMRKRHRSVKSAIAHFATSGTRIDLSCITHSCAVQRAEHQEHDGSWTEYAVVADVAATPSDQEFLLVVHGTYWDGFRDGTAESADTYLDGEGNSKTELRLVVLFPPAKPARIRKLRRVDDSTKVQEDLPVLPVIGADTALTEINWTISKPVPGSHYVVEWTW